MARINCAPWRNSVIFEPFGPDIDAWFRKIGFILSPSDDESFHLSIAEGMASGAIPIIRLREEVPGLYPSEYTFSDVREAVELIECLRRDGGNAEPRCARLKTYVRENYDLAVVMVSWERMIQSVADEAQNADGKA